MRPAVVVFAGLVVGVNLVLLVPDSWLVHTSRDSHQAQVWACPMMCARLDHPGKCPVCGMDLEKIAGGGDRVVVSSDQARVMGLRTAEVRKRRLVRPIHVAGVVEIALGESPGLVAQVGRTLSVKVELFEQELFWIAIGQTAQVTFDLNPGQVFRGAVSSVAAVVKPETRTTTAWISVDTAGAKIPTGTLATLAIEAVLDAAGTSPAVSLTDRYTCRIHPQVRADNQGNCPVCGLALSINPTAAHEPTSPSGPTVLAVPRDAVISTGTRHLAYVRTAAGTFEPREIAIGPRAGEWIAVARGLSEGEVVAEHGSFLLDSHLELAGPR